MNEKYVLVGCAFFNWSETQRMIEIADELNLRGYKIVFIGEGKYDFLLKEKPFIRIVIPYDNEWYTEERISKMLGMDASGNNYATTDEINNIVTSEIEVIKHYNPLIILTGYRMSLTVSARCLNIPIAWCLSATLSKIYLEKVLRFAKEFCKNNKELGKSYQDIRTQFENKIACERLLENCKTSKHWNEVLRSKNITEFTCDLEIYTGNINLMSDARELFNDISETEKYRFIGPILNNEKIEMPQIVNQVISKNNGRKKVLISIGSGGKKELFKRILNSTKNLEYDFFVSVVGILDPEEIKEFPPNYYFCDKFPLVEISQVCDAAIIQGGQGTLYAVIAGKCPFIALPATFEQRQNVENILRNNTGGKIINLYEITERLISNSLIEVLENSNYKKSVSNIAEKIQIYFSDSRLAPKNAADYIEEYINDSKRC